VLTALAVLGVAAPAGAKSQQTPKCVVPRLTGDTLATARRRLRAAHCTLGTITEPQAKNGQTLIVSRTTPKAGSHRKNKARVSVMLKLKVASQTTTTPTTTTTSTATTTPTTTTTTTAPSLASTYLNVTSGGACCDANGAIVIGVSSLLEYADATGTLAPLYQTSVTYTLTDGQTGQAVATFTGTASPYTECSIAATANYPANTTETYVGETENGNPACSLSSVTVPYNTVLLISASYAGSSTYAPSNRGSPVGLI
jgi:hypothetical protein